MTNVWRGITHLLSGYWKLPSLAAFLFLHVRCRRKCLPECICTWSLFLIFLRIVASELLVLDHRQRSQQQLSRSSMATLAFCLSLSHSPGFQKEQSHSIHRSEGTTLRVCLNLLILTDTQTRPVCVLQSPTLKL